MKVFVVLSAILAICAASPIEFAEDNLASVKLRDLEEDVSTFQSVSLVNGVYETPLDHFQPTDPRRLRLVYHANVEHFEENGPLFFFLDDAVSGTRWIQRGLVVDLARELRGAVITANNRYFGRNRWWNSTVENLRFFTVDHILADVPHLITKVKEDLDSQGSRVVVWGSGVSGSIAALSRKKFPHHVDGVWSSSGVFRAVSTETTFYNSIAWSIFNRGPENCSTVLSDAFTRLRQLVDTRNAQALQRLFNLCSPVNFENTQEVGFFYETIFNSIAAYVNQRHNVGIQEFCTDLNYRNDSLRALGRWVRHVFGSDDDECATVSYAQRVAALSNVTSPSPLRPGLYFHCTQFGLTLRVTPEDGFQGIFPPVITEEYQDTFCRDVYGNAFNRTLLERAVENVNVQHGAQNQVISNAIFTNGNLDPYLDHGISEYDIYNSEALTTQNVGSSADLDSISEDDSRELTATKEAVVAALRRFVTPPIEVEGSDEDEGDDSEEEAGPFFVDLRH